VSMGLGGYACKALTISYQQRRGLINHKAFTPGGP
jgi:hypothetical protein